MAEDKISFNEFQKLDLRVAEILEVEDIENADKLFKLKISLGNEERTIVAGLKQHYKRDDLIGKQIIVVANLEPATLKGIESNGMLLAAVSDDCKKVILLKPEKKISAGTKIS